MDPMDREPTYQPGHYGLTQSGTPYFIVTLAPDILAHLQRGGNYCLRLVPSANAPGGPLLVLVPEGQAGLAIMAIDMLDETAPAAVWDAEQY